MGAAAAKCKSSSCCKTAAAAKLQLAYFVSLYLSTPISQPQCGRFGSEICGLRRTVYDSVGFNLPKHRDKNGLFLSKEHKGHLLLSPTIRSKLAEGFMKSWSYLLHNSRWAPPQRHQRIVKISKTKKHCNREPGAVYSANQTIYTQVHSFLPIVPEMSLVHFLHLFVAII